MVPVRLSLHNFLSYGEAVPPLDFTGFRLACLSGRNGNGKSALLDAITWALWGEARKATAERNPEEGLLRRGRSEMRVEFEFDLEAERFRVIRRYRKGRRGGKVELEFQIYDPHSDGYLPLTQAKTGDTQKKIHETLRMDYGTFINSAFILQGRAGEFTRLPTKERKAILADILNLSRYDELADLAREHSREVEKSLEKEEGRLEQIAKELGNKDRYQQELERLIEEIRQCESLLVQEREVLQGLGKRQAELAAKEQEVSTLTERLGRERADLEEGRKQITTQGKVVQEYEAILARREKILAEFSQYEALMAKEGKLAASQGVFLRLQQEKAESERKIERARAGIESELKRAGLRLEEWRRRIKETEEILAKKDEVERGCAELERLRQERDIWEEKRARWEELSRKRQQIESAIQQARTELETRQKALYEQLTVLEKKAATAQVLAEELRTAREKLSSFEAKREELEKMRQRWEEVALGLERLKGEQERAEREVQENQEKLHILQGASDPSCPLCESDLGPDHRERLMEKLHRATEKAQEQVKNLQVEIVECAQEQKELALALRHLQEEIKKRDVVQAQVAKVEAAWQEAVRAVKEAETLRHRMAEIEGQIARNSYASQEFAALAMLAQEERALGYDPDAHHRIRLAAEEMAAVALQRQELEQAVQMRAEAQQEVPLLESKLSPLSHQLRDGQYALEERRELARIEKEMASLGYDIAYHQDIRQALDQLRETPLRRGRLAEVESRAGEAWQSLERLKNRTVEQGKELLAMETKKAQLAAALRELATVEQSLKEQEKRVREREAQRDRLREKWAVCTAKYQECLDLEKEKEAMTRECQALAREKLIYDKLTVAFGKDGIQALIIENAIPEIEAEANEILSRLTHNRAHISIESLREKKIGGTRESLDIKISDEVGTRDYEMFSGGEAFRIDFALRIALSKLLARRAGTRLRTLAIDEGFGTQDPEGLDRLVEAIQVIQEDFDKILVITHMEELKNLFPVRIEVTKHPEIGSTYQVIDSLCSIY